MRRRWFAHCSHIIIHFAWFPTPVWRLYLSKSTISLLKERTSHWEKIAKVHRLVCRLNCGWKKNCARIIKAKIAILLRINRGILRDLRVSLQRCDIAPTGEFIERWIIYFHVFCSNNLYFFFVIFFFFFFYKKTLLGTANSLYIKYFAYENNRH